MIAAIYAAKSTDQNVVRRRDEELPRGRLPCAQCGEKTTDFEIWRNSGREITLRYFADLSAHEKSEIEDTRAGEAFKEFVEVWSSRTKVEAFCGSSCFDAWIVAQWTAKVSARNDERRRCGDGIYRGGEFRQRVSEREGEAK